MDNLDEKKAQDLKKFTVSLSVVVVSLGVLLILGLFFLMYTYGKAL